MAKGNRGGQRASSPTPMTEEEFLSQFGLASPLSGAGVDMIGGANQTRMSPTQRAKLNAQINSQADDYYKKRANAKQIYQQMIKDGKIRDKTRIEKVLDKAKGHSDNASVQSARRMATKMGYDWKTGKKLKK